MAKKTNFKVNGHEYFKVTRTIGHKADGTPVKKTFYGSGINEANQKADEYVNNIKNGLITNYDQVTLLELMHIWIFDFLHNSSKIKPSTFQRYEGLYRNYIKPSNIAGLKIINITLIQMQKFFNDLSENHSYSQLNYLNTFLKTFFYWCIDCGYIIKNPCCKVEIHGNKNKISEKKHNIEILTEEEIRKIKEYIKDSDMELLILLDFATGLRQGELLALDWNCIDLNKQTIEVKRSIKEVYVYESENKKHIETMFQIPKTPSSYRKVPIPKSILLKLKRIEKKQGLLFHDENGNPLRAKNVYYQWIKILKKCDISHRKFHSIRHTYASMLLKNGIDIETVAELMGHSAISITQIYLHSTGTQKKY